MSIVKPLIAIAFFASTLVFMSCESEDSADVNQDRIYTSYELFYNSNTDKTLVVARFRFGNVLGTTLELNDPAFATFNDDILSYSTLYLGHVREYAGQLTGGTFRYTDVDGNLFENDVPAYESIAFPQDLSEISKSEAYDLVWEGTSLSANQRVGLFIGSWAWGEDALYFQDGVGANNIVLGTGQLANLPNGTSTFYMDRSTQVPLTEGTSAGGEITGKFRALNRSVTITD